MNGDWFSTPDLPQVSLFSPANYSSDDKWTMASGTGFRELSLDYFINKLKTSGSLKRLEWLILFNRNDDLEMLSTAKQKTVCYLIWETLLNNPQLFQQTISRVMRGVGQNIESSSSILLAAMPTSSSKLKLDIGKVRLAWCAASSNRQWETCASIAQTQKNVAADLVVKLGFSNDVDYIKYINAMSANVMPARPSVSQQQWWVECQDEVPAKETIRQLGILIPTLKIVDEGTPLDSWLRLFCLPDSKDTIWDRLSKATQDTLSGLYNVTSYDVVKKFFVSLRRTSGDCSLADYDQNRLQKRIDFWSDYSDSFLSVRFLLTERSRNLLQSQFNLDSARFTTMPNTAANNLSEICIFEFKKWIVIEFFRGYEPTKIFAKDSIKNYKALFHKADIDMRIINQIEAGMFHDHDYLWQYSCKTVLKKRCDIYPNMGSSVRKNNPPNSYEVKKLEQRFMELNQQKII